MFVTASAQDVSVVSRDGFCWDAFTIMINNRAAPVSAKVEAAIEIDPSSWIPRYTLGEAYATIGHWREAAEALREAHRLAPGECLVSGTLAGVLRRTGERAAADAIIREMGDAPRPLISRVLYHVLCEEVDHAAEWYERAISERDPFALIFAPAPLASSPW